MKAQNWTFEGYLPDQEDLEAEGNARQEFWAKNKHLLCSENPAVENHIHIFVAAFNRGMAWALAKHGVEVKDKNKPGKKVLVVGTSRDIYGIGLLEREGEYEMLAGPFETKGGALEWEPTQEEIDIGKPIFLLRLNGEEEEILYRWHPTLGWKPRKREVGGMERTT